jgi:acyl carrier protein
MFELEKKKFIEEQEEKIDILKRYLDAKLAAIKTAFDAQTDPDQKELESRIDTLNRSIADNIDFMKHLRFLKDQFKEEIVPNVLENFPKAGQLVNFYRRLSLQEQ